MIKIKQCSTDSDYTRAKQMVNDYFDWLNMDLGFQDIKNELSIFPSMYGLPTGFFLIALKDRDFVGCVGLRMLAPEICELKRLYVYDQFKNMGIGKRLCTILIKEAKMLGYKKIRLDTLDRMEAAIGLYKSLGFKEIEPYRNNPDITLKYMALCLT